MRPLTTNRILPVLLASALSAAGPAVAQDVDTSEWVCELCPFGAGYDGTATAGVTSASDDSAYFGDATGYDEAGAYGNLDTAGTWTSDNHYLRWNASDLLLDSRSVLLDGGKPGHWDYELSWREIPRHEYFTTDTVFTQTSGSRLDLPDGWVTAPQTSGFTQLDSSLSNIDIEGEHADFGVGGRYFIGGRYSASVSYRRHENDGTQVLGGPSYTTASQLPAPYDYTTDEVDLGVEYLGDTAYLALGWLLSDFSSAEAGLTWETPFTALPGAETSELAQAPDSRFQQMSARGGYALSFWSAAVSGSVAVGEITQDMPFLAYTTNPNLATDPLPASDLDGSVDVRHYAVSLSAKPLPKARVRATWRQDDRDNGTSRETWNRVIVDSFTSGEAEQNTPYSSKRNLLSAEASYDLFSTLRISGGAERREIERDYQEVAEQTEDTGWLGLRWHFGGWLEAEGRGGTAKRDIDRYDETVAASLGQNPLLRKYNLAYRYREFVDFRVAVTPASWPVTLAVDGLYADDSYTQSLLGMQDAEEVQFAADFTWTFSETFSWYVDLGLDRIESSQNGSESFASPDWSADYDDAFVSFGTGIRWREIAERMDLTVDLRSSDSASEIRVESATGAEQFPDFETRHDALRARLDYRWSPRLLLEFGVTWQSFDTDDWMLAGVDPATIPAVLSLGADPFDDEQVLFAVGFRYDIAAPEAAAE
jgi:MtrB/PioB family decaheme-associated outer membrane protein